MHGVSSAYHALTFPRCQAQLTQGKLCVQVPEVVYSAGLRDQVSRGPAPSESHWEVGCGTGTVQLGWGPLEGEDLQTTSRSCSTLKVMVVGALAGHQQGWTSLGMLVASVTAEISLYSALYSQLLELPRREPRVIIWFLHSPEHLFGLWAQDPL